MATTNITQAVCELLHQFIIWYLEASCLHRLVQCVIAFGITSGFSSDQMYRIHRNFSNLPQILDFCDNDIVVTTNNLPQVSLDVHCDIKIIVEEILNINYLKTVESFTKKSRTTRAPNQHLLIKYRLHL